MLLSQLYSFLINLCIFLTDATHNTNTQDFCDSSFQLCSDDPRIIVFTVAAEINDAVNRFLRSAKMNGFDVEIVGLGKEIKSDVQKIIHLRNTLEKHKSYNDLILFLDSANSIFNNNKNVLLEKYRMLGSGVVFGTKPLFMMREKTKVLNDLFPDREKQLDPDMFMGQASKIYRMLHSDIFTEDEEPEQFYRNVFRNQQRRDAFDIKLDNTSTLFLNLNGSLDDLDIKFTEDTGFIRHKRTEDQPIVIRGYGPVKMMFSSLTNYLDHNWTPERGCQHCSENKTEMLVKERYPIIQVSVFVDQPIPFLDIFLERMASLTYPKPRIHFTVYISVSAIHQQHLIEKFNLTYGTQYRSVTWLGQGTFMEQAKGRNHALEHCLSIEDCEFLFMVSGTAQLTYPDVLQHLVSMNRSTMAPLLSRRGNLWSNFWGDMTEDGAYKRSADYIHIVEGRRRGIWNVPYIRDAYLLSRRTVETLAQTKFLKFTSLYLDISATLRNHNIFLMLDNQHTYGYLISFENSTRYHLHNDLWEIFDNPKDWEEQYIDPKFFAISAPEVKMADVDQPCPDVFWFPMLTKKFCRQLIEEMEYYGQWSTGSNEDPRLDGGYENVPTRDIHMRQVDWEDHWMRVLDKYVYTMQRKVFEGYDEHPSARLNFVVRYRPDEQPALQPHCDASSYSLNIALNEKHVDFAGGGTRYLRYNCSVLEPRVGWVIMNPGSVTHNHEGLETTSGVRYIFVTFVNP